MPVLKNESGPKGREKAHDSVRGTFNQIQDMGYSITAARLDLAMLSVLTRLGMGKKVGEAPKPPGARGKAAGIWELPPSITFTLTKD